MKAGAMPLRERRSLAEEWSDYEKRVIHLDASETQRTETRRAFYAGAIAMYQLTMNNLDADAEPTELDVAWMEGLRNEMQDFVRSVRDGGG